VIAMAYAPAVVLLAWSLLASLGLRGDLVTAAALVATVIAVIVHANAVSRRP
jgi:hypothetical protein